MAILDLTIDLPKSAYTITDKPTTPQRIVNGLTTFFSTFLLFIAFVGIAAIWTVNIIGSGLEWAFDAAELILQAGDNLIIIAIAAIAGLLMGGIRTVAYVA